MAKRYRTEVTLASGRVVYVEHDGTLSDDEIKARAKEQGLLESFKKEPEEAPEPAQEPSEPPEENLAADLTQTLTRTAMGPVELGQDILNAAWKNPLGIAGNMLGVKNEEGELVPEETVTKFKNLLVDNLSKGMQAYGADVEKEDIIEPETGEYKEYSTLTGGASMILPYFVVGAGAYKTAKPFVESVSKLPQLAQTLMAGGMASVITENALYSDDPSETIAGIVSDLDEEGVIQLKQNTKDFVEFFQIKEDDDALDKRIKLSLEAMFLSGAFDLGLEGLKLTAKGGTALGARMLEVFGVLKGQKLSPEEQAEQALKMLKEAREEIQISRIEPTDTMKFSETPEGLAQVEMQQSSFINRFLGSLFTSRGYFTPLAFNMHRDKEYATRQIIQESENIAMRLQRSLNSLEEKGEVTDKVRQALTTKYDFDPKATLQFKANKMGLPVEVAENVLEARELIDSLSSRIVNSNIPDNNIKNTIEENVGQYLRQSYRMFEDAGYTPDDAVVKRFVQQIQNMKMKTAMEAGPITPDEIKRMGEEAQGIVDSILDGVKESRGDVLKFFRNTTAENRKILLERQDLSKTAKEFFGEIENPSENVILTVTKMARLVENNRFNENLKSAALGKYLFEKEVIDPKTGNVISGGPVTRTSERTGRSIKYNAKLDIPGSPLDGMYTTPEIKVALEGLQDDFLAGSDGTGSTALRIFSRLKGETQKSKTVRSIGTHMRNIFGGAQFGLANGMIYPFHSGSNSLKIIANQQGWFLDDKALTDSYQRYTRLGVINTSVKVNEYRRALRDFNIDPKGFIDRLPIKTLKKIDEGAEAIYLGTDDFYKMNAFEYELKTLKKAFPNESEEVLEMRAAQIIRNTFPNYDLVPPFVKNLRYLPVGNFPAFPSEIIRTSINIVKQAAEEINSGNRVIAARGAKRLTGFTLLPTLGFEGASQGSEYLMGFDEAEAEAAQANSETPWSKATRIHAMVDGKPATIDTRFIDSYNTIKEPIQRIYGEIISGERQGKELDEVLSSAAEQALISLGAPYAEQSILTEAINDIRRGVIGRVADETVRTADGTVLTEPEMPLGEFFGNVAIELLKTFEPGTTAGIRNIFSDEKKAAFDRPRRDPYLETLALAGFRITPRNDDETVYYAARNYIGRRGNQSSTTPSFNKDEAEILESFQRRLAGDYKAQQDLYDTVRRSRLLIGDVATEYELRRAGIGTDQRVALFNNRPYFTDYVKNNYLDLVRKTGITDQEKYSAYIQNLYSIQNAYEQTPLTKVEERPRPPLRSAYGKGGEVYNVPQVPVEPDERIDKMTGRPYDQQAGGAFIDEEDRQGFAAGALVKQLSKMLAKAGTEPAVNRELATQDYVDFRSAFESIDNPEEWQAQVKEAVKQNRAVDPVVTTPELEESAKQFEAGLITRGEHLENIEMFKPISEYTNLPVDPTNKELVFSLKPDQRENGKFVLDTKAAEDFGVSKAELAKGDKFNGRLDIPAYKSYDTWIVAGTSKPGQGTTYAKAVHYEGKDGKPVRFLASEAKGMRILKGEDEKTGYATVSGWVKNLDAEKIRMQAELYLNDPDWTQVGFDPRRQTPFYVREEGKLKGVPVTEADEVIQIGPLVLAKNVVMDLERTGLSSGGITRRYAVAKGGKIDKKSMACNKPRRTPSHPKKSHVVKACEGGKEKIIRFGEQGAKTAGKPKAGESARMKAKRKSFKARHRKNIKRGKMSAAYWADKVKW